MAEKQYHQNNEETLDSPITGFYMPFSIVNAINLLYKPIEFIVSKIPFPSKKTDSLENKIKMPIE